MSLFQSPKLYPQKLLPKVIPGIEKTSRNLCYSTNVVKGWEEITSAIFFNLPLGVRIETSRDIEFASKSNHSGDALKILHIGRDTPWKKPELAAIFAQKVAALGIKVELHYLGIKETNSIFRYQRKPNLEIYFHGLLKNIDSELFTSDILVNLFDCSLSLESIGVGALEALALGKSVVIEKMGDTSFNNLYGIYEREEILKLLTDNVRLRRSPLEHISMTEDEYRKNLNEISISTYTERLLAFIDKFTEGSTIKGS
jgi:glycosyltransferase involved in cell wall biosynthesis